MLTIGPVNGQEARAIRCLVEKYGAAFQERASGRWWNRVWTFSIDADPELQRALAAFQHEMEWWHAIR